MKKHIIAITTLIGFIIGLFMAYYTMFVEHPIGLIDYMSLPFVLDWLPLTEESGWVVGTIYPVVLYTLYGAAIGYLIKKFGRAS